MKRYFKSTVKALIICLFLTGNVFAGMPQAKQAGAQSNIVDPEIFGKTAENNKAADPDVSPGPNGAGSVEDLFSDTGPGIFKNVQPNQPPQKTQEIFSAVYANDLNAVKKSIEQGADVNSYDEFGQTPLHIAQNDEMIRLLIKAGADVNARNTDFNMTPIFNKEVSGSKILTAAGADINARSKKGNTPLMWYCYSGYLEGIKYMVSLGADVNAKNEDGQTAYDIAEQFHPQTLLQYLRSIGAKPGKEL